MTPDVVLLWPRFVYSKCKSAVPAQQQASHPGMPLIALCLTPSPCLLQVTFRDPVRYKLQKVLTVAAEGVYSGQVRS